MAPWIISVKSSGGAALPILSKATVSGRDVFFAAASLPSMPRVTPNPYEEPAVFAALAPEMIFLRYAAGEQAWHAPGHYANLTIDDAWLREPYGHVNYQALLREMEQHNFHTTLAFVPWNYDRSQPAVVDLFRTHPNRFSICIHGDNHDHQEFGPYKKRPLSGQITDIKQAIARMEKFSDLTGLPFDRVMVFPHSISPERTLEVLKHYNFLATVNSLNVPSDAAPPSNPLFPLRAVTLAFSNFPSLRRYSAEAPIPKAQLAVDAFLGNPLLFYAHQEYFASGSGAFDHIADTVNRLYPDAKWESLGYIASHLYLLKARADGNYDVRAYSSQISLRNPQKKEITFYVRKAEDFHFPLSVSVDGKPYPYAASRCRVLIRVTVPAGKSRYVAITYKNDFSRAKTDIARTSPRIYAIRLLSDFRDDVVSRSSAGRWFIRVYSGREVLWNDVLTVILCLSIVAGVLLWRRNR
jgi:peptidoglycan/xylan/chitin deacetylase (PgdA/CDA1 family)